jgi:molybdopterin converting factor small subunit
VRIEVELFATLAAYLPTGATGGPAVVDIPEQSTVDDLCRALGIPASLASIVLVNGHDAGADRTLADGDVVTLFPPLAGGVAALPA